ncbi:MAG TPA: oligosaccharide flippase family protein [Candidatus Dormibacteraeota bacterium]|nr:oligosaccharide flippase family protein [Candidatus Dormibacteraeota bacterium]
MPAAARLAGAGSLMPMPASGPPLKTERGSRPIAGVVSTLLSRAAPRGGLLRSSAILFFGGSLARAVGFLFSVAAARLLLPADYGLLAYGLAIVGFASILVTSAPSGLAAFLSRYQGNRRQQELHFSNWLVVISILIAVSAILMVPIAVIARLSGPMLIGIIANLLGIAVLQTYREAQRGLERFAAMVIFYLLANVIQLFAVLVLAAFGFRSAAVFLTVYGLSSLAALAVVQPLAPLALGFVRETVELEHIIAVARFIQPLVLQTVFFAVWIGADLILVQRLMPPDAAGNYAAAKALANAVYLAPSAVSGVVITRVSRMPEISLRGFLLRVMALGVGVTMPLLLIFVFFGGPLTSVIFGSRYPQAAEPLAVLSAGMAVYGVYLLLSGAWRGMGRLAIDAWATGAGTLATVGLGLLLVTRVGLIGAAIAFTAGSVVQLLTISGYTVRALAIGAGSRLDVVMAQGGSAHDG